MWTSQGWTSQGCKSLHIFFFIFKNSIYPPPIRKFYFLPLSRHIVFWVLSCTFCLNSSIYSFLFCISFSPFLYFPFYLFPFFPFPPFLPFSLTFSPFFSSPFHIFPNDIGWFPPPLWGCGYFPIYRPMSWFLLSCYDGQACLGSAHFTPNV